MRPGAAVTLRWRIPLGNARNIAFWVVLFLLMNAFFVIAEFSLVRVRKSQIEILVEEGKKGAKRALEMADNVNEYLSACQLGITLASLALGWLRLAGLRATPRRAPGTCRAAPASPHG